MHTHLAAGTTTTTPRPSTVLLAPRDPVGAALPPHLTLHLSLAAVQRLLAVVLPRPPSDLTTVLALLTYHRRRNWAAYRAHRRRRLCRLNELRVVELSL